MAATRDLTKGSAHSGKSKPKSRNSDITMRRAFLFLLGLAALSNGAVAQQVIEYGAIEELTSVDRYFVDAGEDLDLRNVIRDVIQKNSRASVVERPEEADHVIVFRYDDAGDVWRGQAIIAKNLQPGRIRILANYRGREADRDDLASDFAKWFIKTLRELPKMKPVK
jgi:hypothetical protein